FYTAVIGLGIVLVLLGHDPLVLQDRGELFRVIYSFHVPLFFFLAGLVLRDAQPLGPFAKARAGALLKPYFVVLFLLGLGKLYTLRARPPAEHIGPDYFLGVLYGGGDTIFWAPLWFLPHLFVVLVAAMAILNVTAAWPGRKRWLWLIAATLLATGVLSLGSFWQVDNPLRLVWNQDRLPGLPWSLDLTGITCAFVLGGFLLGPQLRAMRFRPLPLLAATAGFAALHWFFDDTMDLNMRLYGQPLVSTLQALLGIYLVMSVACLLQRYRRGWGWLGYVGSGSLFILLFHPFAQGKTFLALLHFTQNGPLSSCLSIALGVLLPLLLLEVVRRQRLLSALLLPRKAVTAIPRPAGAASGATARPVAAGTAPRGLL
ncbi:MAG: acyltransferase 3, partial [Polaromonas sp.]|nr:acyltransferase 3 [Polaromonas sp.]